MNEHSQSRTDGGEPRGGTPENGPSENSHNTETPLFSEKVKSLADEQKEVGARNISQIAQAVDGAARELEAKLPAAASYVHTAADRLQQASTAISNRGVGDLLRECRDFARRDPASFLGGAVIVGFAASRFFKTARKGQPASTPNNEEVASNGQ